MTAQPRMSVLFVCLGNICRSPLAEGLFRRAAATGGLEQDILIDSAGTGAWHVGSAPDPRSIAVARQYGVDIAGQRARKVAPADFARFDLILGMDRSNVVALEGLAPADSRDRVHLYLDYATGRAAEVPDPYYGGHDGFDSVYRMLHEASEALSAKLGQRVFSAPESGHASSTI